MSVSGHRRRLYRARVIGILAGAIVVAAAWSMTTGTTAAVSQEPWVRWDPSTLTLVREGGCYGRMERLGHSRLMAAYEWGGSVHVSFSEDGGKSWGGERQVVKLDYGNAANPWPLALTAEHVLLFFNERPNDGKHPFAISMCRSNDGGRTWSPKAVLYEADTRVENGCWEPAPLRLPDGEIRLLFANEGPYRQSSEQEISMMISRDEGRTWSRPETVSFRRGARDGMPAPVYDPERKEVLMAIEDSGMAGLMKPVIVRVRPGTVVKPGSPDRWSALAEPLPPDVFAGAPYLVRVPDGRMLLSVQSSEGGRKPRMVVYVGEKCGHSFHSPTEPFPVPPDAEGLWNALLLFDERTVIALSTTTLQGKYGLWAIQGRLAP